MNGRSIAAAALLVCAWLPLAQAEGIYSCVDAKGRRLTADRPILDCIDREQKVLNADGSVKRTVPPSLTADERAAEEAKTRRAIEERNRLADEKKRNRALVSRYPDKSTHDRERASALALVDDVIVTANRRIRELQAERQRLDLDLEFYNKDPARIPAKLKRQVDENEQNVEAQKRFVANQELEKKRINARFDEELVSLRQLWAQVPVIAAPASAPASSVARRARP
jgi:hypothetical protein